MRRVRSTLVDDELLSRRFGPALGLRAYFALTVVLMFGGLALWLRGDRARQR